MGGLVISGWLALNTNNYLILPPSPFLSFSPSYPPPTSYLSPSLFMTKETNARGLNWYSCSYPARDLAFHCQCWDWLSRCQSALSLGEVASLFRNFHRSAEGRWGGGGEGGVYL